MIKVLPSTNPCPEEKLIEYVREMQGLGVEYLHCDVMDGKFVTNKCLDYSQIETIRINTNILLDVHLMVINPYQKVIEYAKLKPSIITIHFESLDNKDDIYKISKFLKSKDIMFGLSIKPNTSIEEIKEYLFLIDLVLIMSVEPGKSGQKFMSIAIDKIKSLKEYGDDKIIIEVDGGINLDNYKEVVSAGADFLVMGSAYYNAQDKHKLLKSIDKHYSNK